VPALVALRSRTPQPLELLEQIERQRGSREIDTEVVLQAQGTLHARQRNTGEAPLRAIGSRRLDDTFRDDLDDELLGDAARRAHLYETELDGIVEQHGADRIGHDAFSIASLGLMRSLAAISL